MSCVVVSSMVVNAFGVDFATIGSTVTIIGNVVVDVVVVVVEVDDTIVVVVIFVLIFTNDKVSVPSEMILAVVLLTTAGDSLLTAWTGGFSWLVVSSVLLSSRDWSCSM